MMFFWIKIYRLIFSFSLSLLRIYSNLFLKNIHIASYFLDASDSPTYFTNMNALNKA